MQVWRLTLDGRTHRVEAVPGASRQVRWYVDDDLVAEKKSMSSKVRLDTPLGRVELRFSTTGSPQRATYVVAAKQTDLVPDHGSPAAAYEDRVRAHPHRYTTIQTLVGAARVIVPIVLTTAFARFALSLPWPDWNVPLPDIPTPELPSVPLPSVPVPDWTLPGWLRAALEKVHYVWPVVLAFVLARAEINRRRKQDEKRGDQNPGG